MTESELQRIEAELAVQLPTWYRDTLLSYPFRTSNARWLYHSPKDVIGRTRDPFPDGEFDLQRWKKEYVAIGETAAGDVYVMDVLSSGSSVLCLSHEDYSFTQEYASFQEFMDDWLDYEQRPEQWRIQQEKHARWFWRRWRRVMLVIVVAAVVLPALLMWVAHMMQQRQ